MATTRGMRTLRNSLRRLVDVADAATGTVRQTAKVADADGIPLGNAFGDKRSREE
ncbi:hypothetical protein ACIRPT_07580 [Streptomyces sp. NPDC101227]|uniref:hypothetical protein n=1 Tax=Streptomyces sp. NPDC101227 TaxID=3366136 RepID=UPI0038128285